VLLNLAVNARDAMPAGGRLRIETFDVGLDRPAAAGHPDRRPGEFVALKVCDNGAGMDDETQRRIFEPFFTTKDLGKGTGMGLAIVLGIVKMSDGWIEVESASGGGTTFTIYLPKVDEEPVADVAAEAPEVPRGSDTVLFVEDDPSVRSFGVRCLRALGYTVLEASKGTDAITIATEYGDRIDLVVSDIVMPGMQGPAVAERIAALRPGIRVLLISGFAERAGYTDSSVSKIEYLAKPYSRQSLGRAVSAALVGAHDLR
jgi:CheY-like chemotaxis protein